MPWLLPTICEIIAQLRRKEVSKMAKTKDGKKIGPVKPYVRKGEDGKPEKVKGHRRSTPN
jgi:hypothetical protein